MTAEDARVAALLEERRGYKLRGLKARVGQVDAELEAAGYTPTPEEPEPAESAAPVEEAGGGSARSRSGRRG